MHNYWSEIKQQNSEGGIYKDKQRASFSCVVADSMFLQEYERNTSNAGLQYSLSLWVQNSAMWEDLD